MTRISLLGSDQNPCPNEIDTDSWAPDFRHLSAFKRVYLELSYSHAAFDLGITRKSVLRMMDNLEEAFQTKLFEEGSRGRLLPSAFAERLYNDMRFLSAAQHRLKDHVATIHETGRVLHIGSSPAVFRTSSFRNLFRELQALEGVRTAYSPVGSEDAGKALVAGYCDLYIGCWAGNTTRFVTQDLGIVPFRLFGRNHSGKSACLPEKDESAFVVALDGKSPEPAPMPGRIRSWQALPENQWLRWLDHPDECQGGTVICGPDAPVDSSLWTDLDLPGANPLSQNLYASFLRHHPYEFLPSLAGRIQSRVA